MEPFESFYIRLVLIVAAFICVAIAIFVPELARYLFLFGVGLFFAFCYLSFAVIIRLVSDRKKTGDL